MRAGLRLAEWVWEPLLSAPAESGPGSGELALAEVLSLRSLLLNLNYRASQGAPIPEAELRVLIERSDGVKMQRWVGHRHGDEHWKHVQVR